MHQVSARCDEIIGSVTTAVTATLRLDCWEGGCFESCEIWNGNGRKIVGVVVRSDERPAGMLGGAGGVVLMQGRMVLVGTSGLGGVAKGEVGVTVLG